MDIEKHTFMIAAGGEMLQVCRFYPPGWKEDGAAPTLVLLHEALGSIGQWRDFPQALVAATGMPALVYDRCGFGGSQPLMSPRGEDFFDRELLSLDDLLQSCGIKRPLLFGHSDGATLALLYAAAYPDRPLAVVSEAAHLFVEEETLSGILEAVQRWQNGDLRERLERYHGEKTESVFAAWAEAWLDPAFRNWNIEAQMKLIRCPVLAIQGESDQFGTIRQLQAICAGVSGRCRSRLLTGCGHSPHRESRGEVLAETAAFIAELTSQSETTDFAAVSGKH